MLGLLCKCTGPFYSRVFCGADAGSKHADVGWARHAHEHAKHAQHVKWRPEQHAGWVGVPAAAQAPARVAENVRAITSFTGLFTFAGMVVHRC